MNTDLSVAPEIAQLAGPFVPARPVAACRTDGRIAGDLAGLAATPQRWWDRVRFDSDGPVRIPVPDAPGTWLLVLPPGATAGCDCRQATALAGEAVEAGGHGGQTRPLRPGRVRLHGTRAPHHVTAAGPGYSVTLHYCPRGDDPLQPPGMEGLRPSIASPREDAAEGGRRFAPRAAVAVTRLSEFSGAIGHPLGAARGLGGPGGGSPCGSTG